MNKGIKNNEGVKKYERNRESLLNYLQNSKNYCNGVQQSCYVYFKLKIKKLMIFLKLSL